ncbi:MAG: methylated-DNA--[protein]-cysteine S-methyltransferase [Myxococcota bacterium]
MGPSRVERIFSPLGEILLVTGDDDTVFALEWSSDRPRLDRHLSRAWAGAVLEEVPLRSDPALSVRDYFEGDLGALEALRTEPVGTDFQMRVWFALRRIPVGQTLSYGQLARDLGAPKAARAVGLANGQNPVSIICPCHRLVGSDGSLTGYAGGLDRKAWLLAHEGARPPALELPSGAD